MDAEAPVGALRIWYLGGPTAVLEIAGLTLLTDPTFDPPGEYPIGDRKLVKTAGPAATVAEVGPVDAILLSHDQHPDNLDGAGRALVERAPLVLSTASAHRRLDGDVRTLPNWERFELSRAGGPTLTITGVPAQHGPAGTEDLVGEVSGFVLSGDGLPTVYVSGDNASLDVVGAIARRFGSFDIALLFAGGAQTDLIPGAYLTLTSDEAVRAAEILGARQVVPLHFEHWQHFTQGADTLVDAFERAGARSRLHLLNPGDSCTL